MPKNIAKSKTTTKTTTKTETTKQSPTAKQSRVFRSQSFQKSTSKNDKYKVLAPKTETLLKNRITDRITKNKSSGGVAFGFFRLGGLEPSKWHKRINYFIFKWQIWHKFNRLAITLIISSSLFFLIYLSFFDTYFLVNNYKLVLGQGSYLSPAQSQVLTRHLAQTRILGLIPVNQYWFLNDYTLTASSQEAIDEISLVQIKRRTWPNEVELEVFTESILLTLSIKINGQREYWQITPSGEVFAQDTAVIREKVVHVERDVVIANLVGTDNQVSSFAEIDFQKNPSQLNRFWFARWVQEELKDKIEIQRISFPSLNDTEVIVTSTTGTDFMFETDTEAVAVENQQRRIQGILNSNLLEEIRANQIAYIDFRSSSKRVFVCNRGEVCEN